MSEPSFPFALTSQEIARLDSICDRGAKKFKPWRFESDLDRWAFDLGRRELQFMESGKC